MDDTLPLGADNLEAAEIETAIGRRRLGGEPRPGRSANVYSGTNALLSGTR